MKIDISIEPNIKKFFFSFSLVHPKKGRFLVYLIDEYKEKYLIAEFEKNIQKMYSIKNQQWDFFIDTLDLKYSSKKRFFIEVHAVEGADISDFFGVTIEKTRKINNKNQISFQNIYLKIPEVIYPQFSLTHKDARRVCMPVSLTHGLSILTGKNEDVYSIIEKCFDHEHKIYGNWSIATAAVSSYTNGVWDLKIKISSDLNNIINYLLQEIPVCVSIQGELKGAYKIFESGHILTIVGIDQEFIYCLDSAAIIEADVFKKYNIKDFLEAWARRSYISFVFQKKN